MIEKKALVVNLFAGPGSGKSTYCAAIFAELKWANIECEMALEYAKEKVWEEHHHILKNQFYVFGKQIHRILRLETKVDVVITDSPILLSVLYDAKNNEHLRNLIIEEHKKMDTMNFFINREKPYHSKGRMQTEEEAKILDSRIKALLDENYVDYEEIAGTKENAAFIVSKIMKRLGH